MVLKLIKHEIKNSWTEITFVNTAIIVISLLFAFLIRVDLTHLWQLLLISLILLYFSAFVLIIINIVRSFNKKIFSNEGYLTLTLPVTIDELLVSKIIVNVLWVLVTIFAFIISLLLIGAVAFGVGGFSSFIVDFANELYINFGGVLISIVSLIVGILFVIITLILVLSILNTGKINKAKLLIGALIYYGLTVLVSWIKLISIIPFQLVSDRGDLIIQRVNETYRFPNNFSVVMNFNDLLFNVIAIVVFYILSRNIIKNKLELE